MWVGGCGCLWVFVGVGGCVWVCVGVCVHACVSVDVDMHISSLLLSLCCKNIRIYNYI